MQVDAGIISQEDEYKGACVRETKLTNFRLACGYIHRLDERKDKFVI